MAALVIENIHKQFKDVEALKGVNLEVAEGELFGLIGPDGAGKTTLFRLIASLLQPSSGRISVLGQDSVADYKSIRRQIGYMPGKFSLYPDLTVEENLNFFATVFGTTVEANYELVKDVYHMLEPFKNRLAAKLSGGMKQKLALSCALIHKPELLLLDEPTTGVDAVSRKEFWEMLKRLKVRGITIVVSTPYMDEASLCDRVALIQNGEIMKVDSPEAITEQFGKPIYSVSGGDIYSTIKMLRDIPNVASAFPFGQDVHLVIGDRSAEAFVLNEVSIRNSSLLVTPIKATIEDCFMDLMGGNTSSTVNSK